jgi:hypothetical protein
VELAYACNLSDERAPVASSGGVGDPVVVAVTFEEFLELYIADDGRLYQPIRSDAERDAHQSR